MGFQIIPLSSAHWLVYYTYSEVRVEGLEILDYLDNLRDKQRFTEQGDALTFESEVKANYWIVLKFHSYKFQVDIGCVTVK